MPATSIGLKASLWILALTARHNGVLVGDGRAGPYDDEIWDLAVGGGAGRRVCRGALRSADLLIAALIAGYRSRTAAL